MDVVLVRWLPPCMCRCLMHCQEALPAALPPCDSSAMVLCHTCNAATGHIGRQMSSAEQDKNPYMTLVTYCNVYPDIVSPRVVGLCHKATWGSSPHRQYATWHGILPWKLQHTDLWKVSRHWSLLYVCWLKA